MDMDSVPCETETEFLYIIQISITLKELIFDCSALVTSNFV
jgi:hypothetical protein